MTARKLSPEFVTTRDYIGRYVALPADELDIVTLWTMGTWTFSPKCTSPQTFPYLYIAAARGSGKTVLGQEVMGSICRNHQATVGVTGPGVFRIVGEFDEETGSVVNMAPTLALDEIDATYSGGKDEPLRQMLNAGYKHGATVPRVFGRTTISFPVFCPKILMGIDNGHLPDTVVDRSIRIDLKRATPEQMSNLEEFYSYEIEEESLEIQAALSAWAVDHSLVLREYKPAKIEGLQPRQWEIARSLVQLASEVGNEEHIREVLHRLMTRNPERPDGKVTLYQTVLDLFNDLDTDRVTTRQILEALETAGVNVPGNSGKGLASVVSEDGIAPDYIRFPVGHPGLRDDQAVQRGYFRHKFDGAFVRFLDDDDDAAA